jgi:hypothetical protein
MRLQFFINGAISYLNPRDFHLRVFETRALGRYASPPEELYLYGET